MDERTEAREIKRSAKAVEKTMDRFADDADRRTVLAGDRTLLATERTYAAAGICLVAAIWRELKGTPITPHPDIKPIPAKLLVPMNFFLMLVAVAALVGIWSS